MVNYNARLEKILVTATAGFIRVNLVKKLYRDYKDIFVIGIDNINDYFDVNIKESRMVELQTRDNFIFIKETIANTEAVIKIIEEYKTEVVINLVTQAGVHYSIIDPVTNVESNLVRFYNILEAC